MPDHKYVYLELPNYVDTWVNGGPLTIRPASAYFSKEGKHQGPITSSELLVQDSPHDLSWFKGQSPRITVTGCTFIYEDGSSEAIPDVYNAKRYLEDGLVLCFSNSICKERAIGLGKPNGPRPYVVRVERMDELCTILSAQIGIKGRLGPCAYTSDHNRNSFLKSDLDTWQDEFRMYWPVNTILLPGDKVEPVVVNLPKGFCRLVETFEF